jgi:hypothetical protein
MVTEWEFFLFIMAKMWRSVMEGKSKTSGLWFIIFLKMISRLLTVPMELHTRAMRLSVNLAYGHQSQTPDLDQQQLYYFNPKQYVGDYVSASMPLKVTSKVESGALVIETQGQPFPVVCIGHGKFMNKTFGFFFSFVGDELTIKENDHVYVLKRSSN